MPKYGVMSQAVVGKRPGSALMGFLMEIFVADSLVSSTSDCSKSRLDD